MLQRYRNSRTPLLVALFSLGMGEAVARLTNLALLIYVSHRFSVSATGAFAFAQGLTLYLMLGIDLGLRHIGARLLAVFPTQTLAISQLIQSKRIKMAVLAISAGIAYGIFGPIPEEARGLVCLYSLSLVGYAFSLDWIAWGVKKFPWMAAWKITASLSAFAISLYGLWSWQADVSLIPIANFFGYLLGAIVLWAFWWKPYTALLPKQSLLTQDVERQLSWRTASWTGVALLCNQAFNSIDVLLLGALGNSYEIGIYNAAYRMVLLILAVYYLLTQALFPTLAQRSDSQRTISSLGSILIGLACVGILLALAMFALAPWIIPSLYGSKFVPAVALLRIIVVAIPLDLLTSFLSNAMMAWGYTREVLLATAIATLSNVIQNIYIFQAGKARSAAWATDISYVLFLVLLLATLAAKGHRVQQQSRQAALGEELL